MLRPDLENAKLEQSDFRGADLTAQACIARMILRALALVLLGCAALYWATGSLVSRNPAIRPAMPAADYLLLSPDSMTSVGTGDVALRPAGKLGVLIASLQTVAGTVLLGLFGFVLGVRMRN